MKDRIMVFSDNLNRVAGLTTSLLYSSLISVDPTKPRCLKYKYLVTGDANLVVSYLTDFDDVFKDLAVENHARTHASYLNVTYGYVNLPFLKEFRIHFRANIESKKASVAMLSDVQILHGVCPYICPENSFQCGSSECLRPDQMCDKQIDCSDGADEQFCEWNARFLKFVDSTLNCSSVSFPEKSNVSTVRNDERTVVKKTANDNLAVQCFRTVCTDNGCLNISETFDSVFFWQFYNQSFQSSLLFYILLFNNNSSIYLFYFYCDSQSPSNCTQVFSNWCLYLNNSTENECFRFQDNISWTLKRCINMENLECVPFSAQHLLSSVTHENFFILIAGESTLTQTANKSAVITNCNKCVQLDNASKNNSNVECLIGEETIQKVSLVLGRLIICEGCQNTQVSSGSIKDTNSTCNESIIDSDCLDTNISVDFSQGNADNSITCHPFCPSGCNCTGESYICVRDRCPAFTERIVLNNIECMRLVFDDRTREYFVKSKHIFKLEIHNSVIRNLKIFSYYSISLHRIVIMHSTFENIALDPYYENLYYISLHSIHLHNVTLHEIVYGMLDVRLTAAGTSTFHLSKATFHFNPEICDISGNGLEDFFGDQYLSCDEVINASYNTFTDIFYVKARILDLSHNKISRYYSNVIRMEVLYINNNRLQSIRQVHHSLNHQVLRIADFSYNNITSINAGDLFANNLIYLNISRNQIRTVHREAFLRTSLLISLDLSYNEISHIFHGTFLPLKHLEELYLQGNLLQISVDMFKGLYSLRIMEVSFYTICCAKPNSRYDVQCIAPVNEISSCEQLIAVPVLNVAILYIAAIAALGNLFVFLYNVSNFRSSNAGPYHILTMNLSCADFLMGVYLYIIAFINMHYTGKYGLNDYIWRHSTICTLSGITATLSSEVSAFIVLLITLDRFIAVKYPFSDLKLTRRRTSVLLFIAWSVSLFLALIPLIPDTNLEIFYAQSGVCVSLPLSVIRKSGWEYSMIVYVGINFFLFLGILLGQVSLFIEVVSVGKSVRSTKTRQREASLAMTLFAIVLTDVFCWLPIGTIGMLTFFGIEVQPDVYAWMIIVVLPINSAINPILYTLTAIIRIKPNCLKSNPESLCNGEKRKAKESIAELRKQLVSVEETRQSVKIKDERTTSSMLKLPSYSSDLKD